MSREDPQLRIRLPIELKEKIEIAAKENTRSMNAEIVQRLEVSFLNETTSDEIISAKDAGKIARTARDELSNIIFKRTFEEINSKVRIGHTSFFISIEDLQLDPLSDDEFYSVLKVTLDKLEDLGYVVSEDITVDGFLIDIPS